VNKKSIRLRLLEPYERPRTTWKEGTLCKVGPGMVSTSAEVEEGTAPATKEEIANASARALRTQCTHPEPPDFIEKSKYFLDGCTMNKAGYERDSQRQKMYRAEDAVPISHKLGSLEDCREFLREVLDSTWFIDHFGVQEVRLERHSGYRRSYANRTFKLIRLQKVHQNKRILLHELTHLLIPRPHAGHGRLFCRIYLELVRVFISEEEYMDLKGAFDKFRVGYKPYKVCRA